jgi:HlyD family secretion protein
VSGYVHQLGVHTVGGVISAQGEPIMLIVPNLDSLTVEARVQPQDIDQLHVGQEALLRFSAFSVRTTPELKGRTVTVAADVSQDPKSGAPYYLVRLGIPPEELTRLRGLSLLPGMPVEVMIRTRERTVMSFILKPLADQLVRTFREK